MTLSPQHLKMARHTLGLPNRNNKPYRNRYFAPANGEAHKDFIALTKQGLAGNDAIGFCWMTHAGALLALERGEKLCEEDFTA